MNPDTHSFTAHIVVMAKGRGKEQAATDILEVCLDHDIACSLHDTDKQADEIERLREFLERGGIDSSAVLAGEDTGTWQDENERLRAALREIAETDGRTLLGCRHEDCDLFPNCTEDGMRGHERGAWRAFNQCAGIAKAALNQSEQDDE